MKIRYNACLSEVSINMPYKEARAFLTALDKVRNHTSNSEQSLPVRTSRQHSPIMLYLNLIALVCSSYTPLK